MLEFRLIELLLALDKNSLSFKNRSCFHFIQMMPAKSKQKEDIIYSVMQNETQPHLLFV